MAWTMLKCAVQWPIGGNNPLIFEYIAVYRAPATKLRQNLSIVAKNENSTEHFVKL